MENKVLTYRPWSRGSRCLLNKTLTLLAFVSALLLTACSDDSAQDVRPLVTVEVVPSSQSFVNVERMAATRGVWQMPTGYVSYGTLNSLFADQTDLINNTIDIFFTSDVPFPSGINGDHVNYVQGLFVHGNDDKWRSGVEIQAGGTYYLYGFIPYISNVSASIAPNSETGKYKDGAVLTLTGLPTVTPNDVCVVVGAKNGVQKNGEGIFVNYTEQENYTIPGLLPGDFEYVAGPATGQDDKSQNYVFLLFDHIYSAMKLRFRVDENYSKLRIIKLKTLELKAYSDDANSIPMKRNVKATITLKANSEGVSPLDVTDDVNVVFGDDESSNNSYMDPVPILDRLNNPVVLPSGKDENDEYLFSEFFGSFVPKGISSLELISTYEVWDRKGNCIRDCVARNTLDIKKFFYTHSETNRGCMYVIDLVLEPTYIYVLSEPDLDNPTITITTN